MGYVVLAVALFSFYKIFKLENKFKAQQKQIDEIFQFIKTRTFSVDETPISKEQNPSPVSNPSEKSNSVTKISSLPMPTATSVHRSVSSPVTEPSPRQKYEAPKAPNGPIPMALNAIRDFFMGGNLVVKIGLIILILGFSFLLKISIEQGYFPPEMRVAALALFGMGLTFIGFKLRKKNTNYALLLQGGGLSLLYLDICGAYHLYQLVSPALALGVLLFAVAALIALAVMQNSQSLAAFGSIGGYLAPLLASDGSGSHIGLFSFYLILNLGVLGIAYSKAWRPLNLLAFFFTFGVGSIWGGKFYRPDYFLSVEPFLISFFLLFSTIAILFAHKHKAHLKGFVDGTLVFANPLITFALQYKLIQHYEMGMAYSALGFAAYYILMALLFRKVFVLSDLVESFYAMGVVFATLAIPLALSAPVTSAFWALEGAGLVWVGVRQKRITARLFGSLMIFIAGIHFLNHFSFIPAEIQNRFVFFSGDNLGALIKAVSGFFASYIYFKNKEKISSYETYLGSVLFLFTLSQWLHFGIYKILLYGILNYGFAFSLLFVVATFATLTVIQIQTKWTDIAWILSLYFPGLLMTLLSLSTFQSHPGADAGNLAWAAALLYGGILLKNLEKNSFSLSALKLHHTFFWLVLVSLATWEISWQVNALNISDPLTVAMTLCVPIFFIYGIFFLQRKNLWPLRLYAEHYLNVNVGLSVIYLILNIFFANFTSNIETQGFPYFPLFNPLDLSFAFAFVTIAYWVIKLKKGNLVQSKTFEKNIYTILGVLVFCILNGMLARSISIWFHIPYSFFSLYSSQLFQTSLTILWGLISMALMIVGTKKQWRGMWICGANLLAATIAKLFFVDLDNSGTIARVISFIGVGSLCLLIGYFSRIPGRKIGEEGSL